MSPLRRLPLVVSLAIALLTLAGMGSARLKAEHAGDPVAFAMCLGGEHPVGHTCLDCCLPTWAPAAAPALEPTLWSSVGLVLKPEGTDFGLGAHGRERPLPRGPPHVG